MPESKPLTIEEAFASAAEAGVEITPEDLAEMQQLMDVRRAALETEQESAQKTQGVVAAFIESFNRFYPAFLRSLIGVGDVLITATQTILIAFGVPGVLIMLLIVEQQRVVHGISLFEVHETLAGFSASALVALNLILELLISWIEHQEGFKEPPKNEFSLALWVARWQYIIGKSDKWEAKKKSPAMRFKVVLRIVTFSILTLALAGSMESVIQNTTGNWVEAIRNVFTLSTLIQMATWAGGLLFALAAVLSAQALAQYVAKKVVEVVAIMRSQAEDKPRAIAEATGAVGISFILTKITQTKKQNRKRAGSVFAASFPSDAAEKGVVFVSGVSNVSETAKKQRKRVTPEKQRALDWLAQYPDMQGLDYRSAAKLADVSYSTLRRAKEEMNEGENDHQTGR